MSPRSTPPLRGGSFPLPWEWDSIKTSVFTRPPNRDSSNEIVVYCTNLDCPASKLLYRELEGAGYGRLRRYADGIDGWLKAGYPLEGEQVE